MKLRSVCLALALGGSIGLTAVVGHRATAQPAKKDVALRDPFYLETPQWPGDLRTKAADWRLGKVEVDKKNPKTKQDLDLLAKIVIYPVTDRKFFTPNIEQKVGSGKQERVELANPSPEQTMDGVMTQLSGQVLMPTQASDSPYFQVEYIQEFAKSLDAAIREVIKRAGNDPKAAIVRVNVGRALAIACKSGGAAHVPLLVELISSDKTPPELQFQALKAAENLIAAADITKYREKPEAHGLKDTEIAPLVNALEGAIARFNGYARPVPPAPAPSVATPPATVPPMPPAKGADPKAPPAPPAPPKPEGRIETTVAAAPYDADVALYLRKQAVRALSKCRKVHYWDANQSLARPGVFLAKIAVGDPSFLPVASPAEFADVAMGLAQMVPDAKVNYDVQLDAVAAAVAGFASWKVSGSDTKESKSTLWKRTSYQLAAAMAGLKANADKSPVAGQARAKLTGLADLVAREVCEPMKSEQENVAATSARPDEVVRWRNEPANQRKTDLFLRDDPKSKVTLPPQGRR
jgi:hypothetical protein